MLNSCLQTVSKYNYYYHLCNLERFLAHRHWENNNLEPATKCFISALSFGYLANTFEYKRTIGIVLLFITNLSNSQHKNLVKVFLPQLYRSTVGRYQRGLASGFENKIWLNTETALTSNNLNLVEYLANIHDLKNFFINWGQEYQEEEVLWQLSLSN